MLEIHAQWDDDARVWYATSEDVPGLVTEAITWKRLIEHLREIIPGLMQANLGITGQSFPFRVFCEEEAIAGAPEVDATAHLMSSTANAARLMEAYNDWKAGRNMQERELLPDGD